jgi:hypothetical protein
MNMPSQNPALCDLALHAETGSPQPVALAAAFTALHFVLCAYTASK